MTTADQIIKNILEVLDSGSNNGIKISRILILISGDDNLKYDRIVQAIGNLVHSQIDFGQLEMIFGGSALPNEKVASFFHLITNGDAEKYDKIADILAS